MSALTCPLFSELDKDIIDDFMECLHENVDAVESDIEQLDAAPSIDLLHGLFRDIHSFKGNCRMVFLDPMVDVIHALEELVSEMRQDRRNYHPVYGEFFMAVIVREEAMILDMVDKGEVIAEAHENILAAIDHVYNAPSEPNAELDIVTRALDELVSQGSPLQETNEVSKAAALAEASVAEDAPLAIPTTPVNNQADLDFFKKIALQIDRLNVYHNNRTESILDLCLATNQDMGQLVNEEQLTIAVYLHDLGMALIPSNIINKPGGLTEAEFQMIREHVTVGSQLLHRIPGWDEAAEMVLEHHERYDGKGYPYGIKGEDIHPGAMLIALADTFYAITNQRADRSTKKSLFSAITLINSEKGTQFNPKIVEGFNDTIRRLYISAER